MKVYFIRHGNTFEKPDPPRQIGIKTDLHLTQKGTQQIEKLKAYFIRHHITPIKIYCGELSRQIQSANILTSTSTKNLTPQISSAFNELDYGKWEGLTRDEIIAHWSHEYNSWIKQCKWPTNIFLGKEQNHIQILNSWLKDILHKHDKNSIVFAVSSQGIIRYLLKLANKNWNEIISKQQMEEYKINPGNFCLVELTQKKIEILEWNNSPSQN